MLADPELIVTVYPVVVVPGAYTGSEVVYPCRVLIGSTSAGHTAAWSRDC
jgi:hypothetical protein